MTLPTISAQTCLDICGALRVTLGVEQFNPKEIPMSKRARKRRDRKKGGANHGKRPNA
ncbi:hypothetical protein Lesp02_20630 [Lentzea sp. NBRC 105346]|nr:hypothetical protein Lesp02_20630 [Lentzea sp. NBRC 105346]